MIYLTGDMHGNFERILKKQRQKLPFVLKETDYVIVCGDFALLWAKKDKELAYNLELLSRLPFTLLWVDGNHEGFNLLEEYPVEIWNGGKVHHIIKDKLIHLMRGQVFNLEGKMFFTFGGASSHDVSGGILDKSNPAYPMLRHEALKNGKPFRIRNIDWWEQELPTEEELEESRTNLLKVGYQVDYVISHCACTKIHKGIKAYYKADILTEYFEELEEKLKYTHWYFGHYHEDEQIDERHTVLYNQIIPIRLNEEYLLGDG